MIADCRVQAKWIYTVSHPRIENGIIEVRSGKVVAVEKLRTRSATSVDLGAVALIPGLVNAHTHLEFSDLTQPLGCRGIAFTEWIKLVVAQRAQSSGSAESKSHSIHAGIKESIDRGCVAIGEIASEPIRRADYGERISTVVFMEVLGRNPRAVSGAAESCLRWLQTGSNNENVVCAISPHAP